MIRRPPRSTLFPYTTLFRSQAAKAQYREALRIYPDYAEAHNNLGNLLVAEGKFDERSEEHTSELQSRLHLVCRLLLEKKKHLTFCDITPRVGHHLAVVYW